VVPRSALSRVGQILALEIGRVTPFAPADVLSGWYEQPERDQAEQVAITHVIARKDLVQPVIAALSAQGQRIARVVISGPDRGNVPVDFGASIALPERANDRLWRRSSFIAAAAATSLAVIAVFLVFSRQAAELELLDGRLQESRAQAQIVLERIDAIQSSSRRIAELKGRKLESPSPHAIWMELTRLLPDTAWLNGLAIDEGLVTIDGTARSAEGLIAAIDRSPLFESVAFTGPVTKMPGGKLDRFLIAFSLSNTTPHIE
jgi:general secretion pathway protein L